VYPIYTDIAEIAPSNADYGNLIFFDNFETATLGTYDANTTQSDFPMAMYIAPDYASNIESSDFCWSYGDTNKLNIVYDETTDNTAIRMGGATTNQIIMRRPATYAFNEKGNFTNPLTAPGIYTIVMDFIIPEGQSFTSVAVRTFDNRCARDDGAGAERKSTNKYVSASGGGTITVTQQILIQYNDITGITRFDFLAQSASTDTYCYLDNVALYFKPIKYVKFEILPEIGIRTAAKTGLRFNGFISEDLHDKASEYGFIVAKSDDEKFTDTTNYTDLVFPKDFISAQQDNVTGAGTTASGVKFICGTSRCSDNNISRYAPETNDGVDGYRFSGVITNLGNKERMTSTLVTRTYVVINDVYYYSGAKTASLYDTAMALPSEEQENPYIKKIIDTCETE
ncbi:MAG: hypothetical protein ACI4RV_05415, partial [Eubacteriales bacterium]